MVARPCVPLIFFFADAVFSDPGRFGPATAPCGFLNVVFLGFLAAVLLDELRGFFDVLVLPELVLVESVLLVEVLLEADLLKLDSLELVLLELDLLEDVLEAELLLSEVLLGVEEVVRVLEVVGEEVERVSVDFLGLVVFPALVVLAPVDCLVFGAEIAVVVFSSEDVATDDEGE